jgi:hypothetical protein
MSRIPLASPPTLIGQLTATLVTPELLPSEALSLPIQQPPDLSH